MDRKRGKFSLKWFRPFTVHLISNKNLCSAINKDGTRIKTKYKVSLFNPYFDSDVTKFTCDENPSPSAIDKQSHGTEKLDPPSLTDKQTLLILVDVVKSSKNSTETCYIVTDLLEI